MKLGFELEFAASVRDEIAIKTHAELPAMFSIGYDSSARLGDKQGLEMRAGIFTQGFPVNKFKTMLNIIKTNGGVVHKTCGFHIHFSQAGEIDPHKMLEFLFDYQMSWKSRHEWCQCDSYGNKYAPFRHIEGDHYEIRVFNSTLSLRGLIKMHEIAMKAIDYSREGSRILCPLAS